MATRTEILCAHDLNIFDLMNIKILPTCYILKRWTIEPRSRNIQDSQEMNVVENPKLGA